MSTSIEILNVASLMSDISQVLLVGGLFLAWKQIETTLKDVQVRSEREAKSLAISEAGRFVKMIDGFMLLQEKLPDNIFDNVIKWKKERRFNVSDFNLVNERAFKDKYEKTKKFLDEHFLVQKQIVQYTSELEHFAMSFMKRLADESSVYDSLAEVYCRFVERFYFFYVLSRRSGSKKAYQNTIDLYMLWKQRQNISDLEERKNIASQVLNDTENELLENRTHKIGGIVPIGTDL